MSYACKILADSVSPAGHRLTTFEVKHPRFILAEANTTRMLSRVSASSRAVPVADKIASVQSEPFIPEVFAKNQKGMQAPNALEEEAAARAARAWTQGIHFALSVASELQELELHKGQANRVLEPYAFHTAIMAATDWTNHENLRVHPHAQGEYFKIAKMMKEARTESAPVAVNYGDWHMPLVRGIDEFDLLVEYKENSLAPPKISAGRCARVSYLTHDGKRAPEKDIGLCDKLIKDGHMSPLEMPARPMTPFELQMFKRPHLVWSENRQCFEQDLIRPWTYYCGNYEGWIQLRKLQPGEAVFTGEA